MLKACLKVWAACVSVHFDWATNPVIRVTSYTESSVIFGNIRVGESVYATLETSSSHRRQS